MGLDVSILATGGGGVSQATLDTALAGKVSKSGDSMSGALVVSAAVTGVNFVASSDGSTGTPAYGFATTGYGMAKSGSTLIFPVNSTTRMTINANGIAVVGSVSPTGQVNAGVAQIGASYATTTGSPGDLEITQVPCQLYLDQKAWGGTPVTTVTYVKDVHGLLGGANTCDVYPFNDFVSISNSLNEWDTVNGVWPDLGGGAGPAGDFATFNTQGGIWRITEIQTDPGISGANGGVMAVLISAGGY